MYSCRRLPPLPQRGRGISPSAMFCELADKFLQILISVTPSPSSGDGQIMANLQAFLAAGCHLFLSEDEESLRRQCSAELAGKFLQILISATPSPSFGDGQIVANLQAFLAAGCHLFLGEDEEFSSSAMFCELAEGYHQILISATPSPSSGDGLEIANLQSVFLPPAATSSSTRTRNFLRRQCSANLPGNIIKS